jgi:hypothetical protein
MMRCHYIMACIYGMLTVSRKAMNNHGHKKTSLSHWRWSFHTSTNGVPSLTIKMADVLRINKEEQLSAMPLDNQGGTWDRISQGTPTHYQESTKIKKGWWKEKCAIVCILIFKIRWCKEKLKARERTCSMDLKPWVLTDSVQWHKGPSVGEEGQLFYSRYNPVLLPPRLPSLWHTGMRGEKRSKQSVEIHKRKDRRITW